MDAQALWEHWFKFSKILDFATAKEKAYSSLWYSNCYFYSCNLES